MDFLRRLVLWHEKRSPSYLHSSPNFTHVAGFSEYSLIASLSPGFRNPYILSQLSVNMINILNHICAYTTSLNTLSIPWSAAEHHALIDGAREAEVRLVVLGSDYKNPFSTRQYSQLVECLFLSLRALVGLMPSEFGFPADGCKHMAAKMRSLLEEITQLASWRDYAGVLLWMTFMGGIVARAGSKQEHVEMLPLPRRENVDDSSFWIFKLAEMSSALGATTKEVVKSHLRRFLWVEAQCEPWSMDLWKSLENIQIF